MKKDGAEYYNRGPVEVLRSRSVLLQRLKEDDRVFALIGAKKLGEVDKAARKDEIEYFVVDNSSAKALLITNRLGNGCETDENPLRRFVSRTPPAPQHPISVNFENKVQLVGYDMPERVIRGTRFSVRLYFKVLGQMPSGWKLFIHFDQPSFRFHGDHLPLDGKYATQHWLAGDYITDEVEIDVPVLSTPSGTYHVFGGFWLGESRLKIIEGPNDGTNRVPLGTLRVR